MKSSKNKSETLLHDFNYKATYITLLVLVFGILITILSILYTSRNMRKAAVQDFEYNCTELIIKIETRLQQHSQLLRSGAALFASSDSITRKEWTQFYLRTRIDKYLPGIQGFGFSVIIPRDKLASHIESVRKEGFSQYTVTPVGDREIYTSIVFIEPFSGRNLLAFGYDMFSDPVRRKAMEISRDSNYAMLSGKVTLVQETGDDVQAGVLMYVPVYFNHMPDSSIVQRRKAIRGWVYSPYRMKDLMIGIVANADLAGGKNKVHFKIYDDEGVSKEELLFDSNQIDETPVVTNNLFTKSLPIIFNGKKWSLICSGKEEQIKQLHKDQAVVLIIGLIIISLLILLAFLQINSNIQTRKISQLNMQLEKLNIDKDRFITILGHDLKSPFTAILGFLELLNDNLRKLSIEEIESHIKIINDASVHTYHLLEDLLMWVRAHSGKIPFNPQQLDLRNIYENISDILKPAVDAKNIAVNYIAEKDLQVYADADMLKAVLRNLLSNAAKFTNNGGVIDLAAEKSDDGVVVSISDNGIGISPERLPKLFEVSQIFTTTGTANEKGSGLGLILCKEFIEKHGGTIWVESEPGKGSNFKFTLPEKNIIDL